MKEFSPFIILEKKWSCPLDLMIFKNVLVWIFYSVHCTLFNIDLWCENMKMGWFENLVMCWFENSLRAFWDIKFYKLEEDNLTYTTIHYWEYYLSFTAILITASVCTRIVQSDIYKGGNDDGYRSLQLWARMAPGIYKGSNNDGYHSLKLPSSKRSTQYL